MYLFLLLVNNNNIHNSSSGITGKVELLPPLSGPLATAAYTENIILPAGVLEAQTEEEVKVMQLIREDLQTQIGITQEIYKMFR